MKATHNVQYAEAIDFEGNYQKLHLDVYQPDESKENKKPSVILIHGGGFESGDKSQELYVQMANEFTKRGYVAFCINYRLNNMYFKVSAEKALDAAVSDALTALNWVRSKSTEFGIANEKIVVAGDSAGGAIVTSLSYNNNAAAGIAACINLWGGMPGQRCWDGNQFEGQIPANAPATLLIHGTEDTIAPFENSVKLSERLKEANVKHELYTLVGAKHYAEDRALEFMPVMIKFADEILAELDF